MAELASHSAGSDASEDLGTLEQENSSDNISDSSDSESARSEQPENCHRTATAAEHGSRECYRASPRRFLALCKFSFKKKEAATPLRAAEVRQELAWDMTD